MPRHLALLTVLLAFSATPGCGYDPLDARTQLTPRRAAVVGTWTPEALGGKDAEAFSRAKVEPSIVLNEDGTFSARDLPDGMRGFERSASSGDAVDYDRVFHTGSGTWNLVKTETNWIVRLHFPKLPSYPGGLGFLVNLFGQEPPYRLGIGLGDPDEGRWLIFAKLDRGAEESGRAPKLRKVRPGTKPSPKV